MTGKAAMHATRALVVMLIAIIVAIGDVHAAAGGDSIHFDKAAKVFRLDAAKVTYAFGVDDRGQLQSLYWGSRLDASDRIPSALAPAKGDAIDGDMNRVRQEYSGWGGGLYYEPGVKITFPDGN